MDSIEDVQAGLQQARRALRARRLAEAVTLYERILERDAAQPEGLEGLAMAHYLNDDCAAAAEAFGKLVKLRPRDGRAHINLGAVFNRLGKYDQAVVELQKGVQIEKKCAEGFYNLGIAYRNLKQVGLAVTAYREALRLDPQLGAGHLNLANLYLEMGNHQQAIVHFQQALQLDPTSERARLGLKTAERAHAEARHAVNPFGRLVSDTAVGRAAPVGDIQLARDLTPHERHWDHTHLQVVAGPIRASAEALAAHVREHLEEGFRRLIRALAEEATEPGKLEAAYADFQPTAQMHAANVRSLTATVRDLRDHEHQVRDKASRPPEE